MGNIQGSGSSGGTTEQTVLVPSALEEDPARARETGRERERRQMKFQVATETTRRQRKRMKMDKSHMMNAKVPVKHFNEKQDLLLRHGALFPRWACSLHEGFPRGSRGF